MDITDWIDRVWWSWLNDNMPRYAFEFTMESFTTPMITMVMKMIVMIITMMILVIMMTMIFINNDNDTNTTNNDEDIEAIAIMIATLIEIAVTIMMMIMLIRRRITMKPCRCYANAVSYHETLALRKSYYGSFAQSLSVTELCLYAFFDLCSFRFVFIYEFSIIILLTWGYSQFNYEYAQFPNGFQHMIYASSAAHASSRNPWLCLTY